MPKAVPMKRLNWRLGVAILVGFLLFVSTAMATRRVHSLLLSNEHFFLESNFLASGSATEPVGTRPFLSRERSGASHRRPTGSARERHRRPRGRPL